MTNAKNLSAQRCDCFWKSLFLLNEWWSHSHWSWLLFKNSNTNESIWKTVTHSHLLSLPEHKSLGLQDNAITLQNVLVTIKYLIPDEGWRLLFMLTLDQWCWLFQVLFLDTYGHFLGLLSESSLFCLRFLPVILVYIKGWDTSGSGCPWQGFPH